MNKILVREQDGNWYRLHEKYLGVGAIERNGIINLDDEGEVEECGDFSDYEGDDWKDQLWSFCHVIAISFGVTAEEIRRRIT